MIIPNTINLYHVWFKKNTRRNHDRMVIGFTTIYATSVYHH